MEGTVIIEGLRLFGRHGVGEQERIAGNTFEFNVRLRCHDVPAMQTDNLHGTISYAEVIDIIKEENALPSALLENLAWRLHSRLTEKFPQIAGGSIEVYKPAPPVSAGLTRAGFRLDW